MKPLIVLIAVFLIACGVLRFINGSFSFTLAGNIAMCAMLCFAALGHFMFAKGMAMMIPSFLPARHAIVIITGILEIIWGAGLLFPTTRYYSGIIVLVYFLLILPVNIHAAINHVDHEKADYNGKGLAYLWFRVPLQVFFIAWVLFFACILH